MNEPLTNSLPGVSFSGKSYNKHPQWYNQPLRLTKEQKQDLMHIAVCTLLAQSGYYIMEGLDEEGWPHFKQLKPMPDMNTFEQENFLKDHILLYFESHDFL